MASITCKLDGTTHTHSSVREVADCAVLFASMDTANVPQAGATLTEAISAHLDYCVWEQEMDREIEYRTERWFEEGRMGEEYHEECRIDLELHARTWDYGNEDDTRAEDAYAARAYGD